MLEIFGHPFSSYTWKVLIPLYENEIPFTFRIIDAEHPDNLDRLLSLSPQGKFPLLINHTTNLFESSIIIEYLQQHFPCKDAFIPSEPDLALQVRMLDRFFDNYVMSTVQNTVNYLLREPEQRDPLAIKQTNEQLKRSYAWLNKFLKNRTVACGESFSLADCAAAPSLFYADWVYEIGPEFNALRNYRSMLLDRNSVKRCIEDARPYRELFPGGAPNRD